jgi:hypothetical protein
LSNFKKQKIIRSFIQDNFLHTNSLNKKEAKENIAFHRNILWRFNEEKTV